MVVMHAMNRLFSRNSSFLAGHLIVRSAPIAKPTTPTKWLNAPSSLLTLRTRYTGPPNGVKGLKGRKYNASNDIVANDLDEPDDASERFNIDDNDYDQMANSIMHVTKNNNAEHSVYVIQPYVKWGPQKSDTEPDLKLQEAEALVRSLPQWSVVHSIKVPLESLEKRQLFGTGKLQEIRTNINSICSSGEKVNCVFVSKGMLNVSQKRFLEKFFGLPVMDRYSIVIQILRLHATSNEAKLQVAAAEIPYIWAQLKESGGAHGSGGLSSLSDTQKELLRSREKKLRRELAHVRSHREILRNKRRHLNFPVIAVVGYTNAGKTSLIQALTKDGNLQPRDQLFATLDVTAHAGWLPSKLKVIYMDTVGFMSDIPTGLIECFVATLEDAMLADIIVHVQDVSHENQTEQSKHVENTLKSLLFNTLLGAYKFDLKRDIINVGNKSDLVSDPQPNVDHYSDLIRISSKTGAGIDQLLIRIEQQVLRKTKRKRLTIKVPAGGAESSWLYKHTTVTECAADPSNSQNVMMSVIISEAELQKFRYQFVHKSNG